MQNRLENSIFLNKPQPNNPSFYAPSESKIKTYNSMVDNQSQYYQDSDPVAHELERVSKWKKLQAVVSKKFVSEVEENSTALTNCYLLVIEEINDIFHKKSKESMKVYMSVSANFYSPESMSYSGRTLSFNLIELQSVSSSNFKTNEGGLAIYFHSKAGADENMKIRIELEILQSEDIREGIEILGTNEYLGYIDIDPFKGYKSKQKASVFSPKSCNNLETNIIYAITVSDSFKILQKLIPANCLCGPQDTIPGLAGRKLPANLGILYSQIQYTELQALKIDITSVDLHDNLLKQKLKQVEEMMKHQQSQIEALTCTVKQYSLDILFHNGWTAVNRTSVRLLDKMEIQKKSLKRNNRDSNVGKSVPEFYKVKHFSCEEIANLSFIFIDDQAVVILQVIAKVEIKAKGKTADQIQTLMIPINYSVYPLDRLTSDQKQIRMLQPGEGTSSALPFDAQHITGKIEFFVHLENINRAQVSKAALVSNQSIVNNRSQLEADKIMMEKERMIKENKKLKQQNRAKKIQLNQEIPLLDTTAYKQLLYKDQIEKIREERREKEQMLEFLKRKIQELNPMASQGFSKIEEEDENFYIANEDNIFEKKFRNKRQAQNYHQSIFYKNALKEQNKILKNYHGVKLDLIKIQKFLAKDMNPFFHCEVPLDIMRTELQEQGYSYAIFINCLSLVPIAQSILLPRKFLFQLSFFKERKLRSCDCEINQSTGEILAILEEEQKKQQSKQSKKEIDEQKKRDRKQTAKIIYVQIGPRDFQNNSQTFIDFIGYLYFGYLQIKIIDQASGHEFGETFLKMKDFIRMRRNEVTVMRDVWVKKAGQSCARLKLEVKCIRKESSGVNSAEQKQENKIAEMAMAPTETRQLQKIARYKAQKQGLKAPSSATEQQVRLNHINKVLDEQFTKSQVKLGVSRMKPELSKIQITNRKNQAETYHLVLNDPDRGLMNNDQLIFINQLFLKTVQQTTWWRYMCALGIVTPQNLKIVDDNNCFDLLPGETGVILLYYYSERKYCDENYQAFLSRKHEEREGGDKSRENPFQSFEHLVKIFNRKRCVEVSASNKETGQLHSLHKINIIPEQTFQSYDYQFVRKASERISIQIPVHTGVDYVLYIDDPTVISTQQDAVDQNGNSLVNIDCYAGELDQLKKMEISLLSPYPENKMLVNYCFSIWGAHEIYIEAGLWELKEVLVEVHTALCREHGLEYLLALSQDQSVVSIRDKNPIKVNLRQSKTLIRAAVTPKATGINHYGLNILSPLDHKILTRFSFKVETIQPSLQQKLTLRIKLTDKIIEQPFSFKNDLAKKSKLKVLSTKPHILWSVADIIEVEARGEKQLKIKINGEMVWDEEIVILSLIGEKIRYNYMFILQLDRLL